ncbi:MAG: T9SS type A sorting domain-containing protein [Cyclobacteriaceae bacterium]
MKSKNLILILILFAQGVNGQVFDKNSNWSIITTNRFDDAYYEITTYKLEGDTTINDLEYYKVLKNDNFYCALRESNNKVYAFFSDFDSELLIYDFNWSPNDTLYHQVSYEPDSMYIQTILGNTIDSIQLLDEKYYKCVRDYSGDISIIRGIGDIRGFFISTFELPLDGSQFALLCFNIGEILVYRNPEYNYCNPSSLNNIIDSELKFNVYPNPSNHSVTIELLQNNIDTLSIFDTKGCLINKYSVSGKNIIETQNLSKGVYIIIASSTNNQKTSTKIIIK